MIDKGLNSIDSGRDKDEQEQTVEAEDIGVELSMTE